MGNQLSEGSISTFVTGCTTNIQDFQSHENHLFRAPYLLNITVQYLCAILGLSLGYITLKKVRQNKHQIQAVSMVVFIMISSSASAVLCVAMPLMLRLPGFSTKTFSVLLDLVELGNCIGFFVHYIIAMKYLKSTMSLYTSKYERLLHRADICIIAGFVLWHVTAQLRFFTNLDDSYYTLKDDYPLCKIMVAVFVSSAWWEIQFILTFVFNTLVVIAMIASMLLLKRFIVSRNQGVFDNWQMLIHAALIFLNYSSLSLLLYLLSTITTKVFQNPSDVFFVQMHNLAYLLAFEQLLAFAGQLLVYYLCWKYSIAADNQVRSNSVALNQTQQTQLIAQNSDGGSSFVSKKSEKSVNFLLKLSGYYQPDPVEINFKVILEDIFTAERESSAMAAQPRPLSQQFSATTEFL